MTSPTVSPDRRTEGPSDSRGRNQAFEPIPRPNKRVSPASLDFNTFLGQVLHSLLIRLSSAPQDKSVTHKSAGAGVRQNTS